jgi:hypothetical protein
MDFYGQRCAVIAGFLGEGDIGVDKGEQKVYLK